MDALRESCPVPYSETSGLRSVERNKIVGGHPKSKHLVGLARDIVPDNLKDKKVLIKAVFKAGLSALDEGDHIHVQPKRGT